MSYEKVLIFCVGMEYLIIAGLLLGAPYTRIVLLRLDYREEEWLINIPLYAVCNI